MSIRLASATCVPLSCIQISPRAALIAPSNYPAPVAYQSTCATPGVSRSSFLTRTPAPHCPASVCRRQRALARAQARPEGSSNQQQQLYAAETVYERVEALDVSTAARRVWSLWVGAGWGGVGAVGVVLPFPKKQGPGGLGLGRTRIGADTRQGLPPSTHLLQALNPLCPCPRLHNCIANSAPTSLSASPCLQPPVSTTLFICPCLLHARTARPPTQSASPPPTSYLIHTIPWMATPQAVPTVSGLRGLLLCAAAAPPVWAVLAAILARELAARG